MNKEPGIPIEKAMEVVRRAEAYEREHAGDPDPTFEQAAAWLAVFDLCRSLGMGITVGKTGLQEVSDFITSLAEARAVVAAAEEVYQGRTDLYGEPVNLHRKIKKMGRALNKVRGLA